MYVFDRETFAGVRDGIQAGLSPQPEFRVTLTFVLHDEVALWSAARTRLLAGGETTDEMVHETIGPPDAPSLADCLAVMCDPSAFLRTIPVPGCEPDDFWIDLIPGLPDTVTIERGVDAKPRPRALR
ncbi:hypothetical protein [Sphingomonas echinoides]|uniref:hypothetical protein n=1 Tax=Sphingomonas echinoides TaxID=59803 RepID=UPI00241340FD|nr:hypothetical protein [Sphingomonas echinoides]